MSQHDHGGHHHGHSASPTRAFAIGAAANLVFVIVEATAGLVAHSMALLADAGHNLGDVLGLALAGGAALLARRKPTRRRTYGFRRITLVSALANGVILLVATGAIAWESVRRLAAPEPVQAKTVIAIALLGTFVNAGSALPFLRDRKRDLNVRAAFLHLVGDAAVSVGVVVTGIVALYVHGAWIDPVASLVIAALILVSTWSLLRRSMDLVLDAVPEAIDLDAVRVYLASLPRVVEVHDLHVWAMSTTETALTAHLVMPGNSCEPRFLGDVCKALHERFGIEHATLQVDPEEAPETCRLAPEGTV